MTNEEFLMRVFRATSFDFCDHLFWRTDGVYAPLTIFVNCNDLFWWGAASLQRLMPENIEVFERSIEDTRVAMNDQYPTDGPLLFCARVRGMRPQPACYKNLTPAMAALYDACGPARDPKECG